MHCPVCDNEFSPETTDAMPFCSARCKSIDLGRWLEEGYSIPAYRDDDGGEENGVPDDE
jgi:uncharacterized protein